MELGLGKVGKSFQGGSPSNMKRTCLLLVAARPFTMSMSTSLNTFPSVAINLSPSFVDTSWFLKDKDKGRGDFAERRVNGGEGWGEGGGDGVLIGSIAGHSSNTGRLDRNQQQSTSTSQRWDIPRAPSTRGRLRRRMRTSWGATT